MLGIDSETLLSPHMYVFIKNALVIRSDNPLNYEHLHGLLSEAARWEHT